ncbi:hypothetical protein PIB30_080595 [Stylosanthes scabra]|uniref:Uncharacterized protein n=1 Tax=Stylosanthes scabra TaxID=79078 RepID=A0ABU6RRB3_9FABA|nr:hypothetical protein [Stylosanthes scabra]
MAQGQARTSPMMLHFRKSHKPQTVRQSELRIKKLSRPEAADEQWRIDSESILTTNGWQFRNFAVRFVLDRTLNVGVRFRVLNIFMIIPMFSFWLRVSPNGAKSRIYGINSRSVVYEKVGVYIRFSRYETA